MMNQPIAILWFRQDLRIDDNPALCESAKHNAVLPIYILDDHDPIGAASRWWLHHSLDALNQSLEGKLNIYQGNAETILKNLCEKKNIDVVYWNRCYEAWSQQREENVEALLDTLNVKHESFNASLLWEPWENLKSDGTPYKVFTPFYKKGCLGAALPPRKPISAPKKISFIHDPENKTTLKELALLPEIPWDKQMKMTWKIGEEAAQQRLNDFLSDGIEHYKKGRDFPAEDSVSRLSPHLHFGEISPHQVWHTAKQSGSNENIEHFLRELAWREFSYSLLFHNPDLPKKNLQTKFDRFPWRHNKKDLERWQQGQTGIPIVDAGMRELWQTGYMHNRVRMIVASFLVKNLLIHWQEGEAWFWDCLVDADLANNSASWQWVAGCGADAAPYFRIFNPVTQGQKFDPEGEYTRQFVPELEKLPNKYLFNPWDAPIEILSHANIILGETYPKPMTDLKISRQRALDAFSSLKVSS